MNESLCPGVLVTYTRTYGGIPTMGIILRMKEISSMWFDVLLQDGRVITEHYLKLKRVE